MALFLPGPVAAEIRGSIGGTTFTRNTFGAIMRQRVKPIDKGSTPQMAIRALMNQLQNFWRDTLTPAERSNWIAAAQGTVFNNKLGSAITISGANAYIRTNVIALLAGLARIDIAPAPPLKALFPTIVYGHKAVTFDLEITSIDPVIAVGGALQIQISPTLSPTRNFWKGPWSTTAYYDSADVAPITIRAPAEMTDGTRLMIQARYLDAEGKLSESFTQLHDVVLS